MGTDEIADAGRQAAAQGEQAAEAVQASRPYRILVKVGLVTYGIVHVVIAWLAFRLALGQGGEEASNSGALRQIAETPLGLVLLWVAVVGLFTLVVWQLIAAAIGYREYDGTKRLRKRLSALLRMAVYGALGTSAFRIATGPELDEGESVQESASAGLMGLPGGQVLVVLVGLGIAAYGVRTIYKGITKRYNEEIKTELSGAAAKLVSAGHIAKGIAYIIMGALFGWAALSYDPDKAGGLDEALEVIRTQPGGSTLLIIMAIGIACYGIWCFFWARHAKHARVLE